MGAALAAYFMEQRLRLQAELEPQIPADRKAIRIPAAFWAAEAKKLLSTVLPFINSGANGGVNVAKSMAESIGLTLDWTLAFTQAADWAREYAGDLVTSVTNTTKERIRSAVANWIEAPDMTLPDLWKQLQEDHAFSRDRAEMIAQTETTRAYAEGEMAGSMEMESSGLLGYVKEWQTVLDNRVCPICEPLQGETVSGVDADFDTKVGPLKGPPAHPRCRCWINIIPQVPG